eukprot:8485026-Pyramimonas_sp.AAC.1
MAGSALERSEAQSGPTPPKHHRPLSTLPDVLLLSLVASPSVLYSDCASVVHRPLLPIPERYSGKRPYSGMILDANNEEGDRIKSIAK